MRLPLIFIALCAIASGDTFDLATFTPPTGWAPQRTDHSIGFRYLDQASSTFCMIGVYQSRPASADLLREFPSEWANIVQKAFAAVPAPAASIGSTGSGLRYAQGGATVQSGNASVWAQLLTFGAPGRVASVLVAANNRRSLDNCGSGVQMFLASFRLSGGNSLPPISPAQPPQVTRGGGSPAPGKNGRGIAGVWMGYRASAINYQPLPRWYTLYEDGVVYEDIPVSGFLAFDRQSGQRDPSLQGYWGTWQAQGSNGLITKPRFTERLQLESGGILKIDSDRFGRCVNVDGLRLDGVWTTYTDTTDPALGRLPQGARPVFRFTRDGRFVDEGVFVHDLEGFAELRTTPAGSGTYEIRDFTLVLRYSDGRVQRTAFSGMLNNDPSVQNDIVYIGKARFNRHK